MRSYLLCGAVLVCLMLGAHCQGGYHRRSNRYGTRRFNNHRSSGGHNTGRPRRSGYYGYGSGRHDQSGYGYGSGHTQSYGYGYDQQPHHQGYGHDKHEYKKNQCYQCSYSPDKVYYKKMKTYEPYHGDGYGKGRKSYTVIPLTVKGGWDKCRGPFSHYEAKHFGIDTWECGSKCYTRKDYNGDIVRGCYKGEYGVNPYKKGCQKVGTSVYCFCEGDKCNNKYEDFHVDNDYGHQNYYQQQQHKQYGGYDHEPYH